MKKLVHRTAFSLVEVTLALGVAAFCLLAVFGLLPIGFNTHRNAISQSIATDILSAVTSDLRATPNTTGTTSQFGINIGAPKTLYFDETGSMSVITNRQVYRLTITFPTNSAAISDGATFADINVTWPAPVDPATTRPTGSVEIFAAFDRH